MAAKVVKEQAARWQVIVPWKRGDELSEVVAAELATSGGDITIKLIGSKQPITFPLERAKMLLAALGDAVAHCEAANVATTEPG